MRNPMNISSELLQNKQRPGLLNEIQIYEKKPKFTGQFCKCLDYELVARVSFSHALLSNTASGSWQKMPWDP